MKSVIYFTMGTLEFCSNCGSKNKFGKIDGNKRFYCSICGSIHYENPKPTATLICPKKKRNFTYKKSQKPREGTMGSSWGFY